MIEHYMRVDKLRELLAELPDDALLYPNDVRNLLILPGDGDNISIGFIDFLEGHAEVVMW